MLGLNAIHYRGEALMLLTRALPLSDTIKTLTTEVTVATAQGKEMHSDGAAELLALLARELPAEIESVKAGLAAQEKAKEKPKATEKEEVEEVMPTNRVGTALDPRGLIRALPDDRPKYDGKVRASSFAMSQQPCPPLRMNARTRFSTLVRR